MNCPECKKGKLRCLGTVTNFKENEIYRKRGCTRCNYLTYTVEYDVVVNESFLKTYSRSLTAQRNRYCKGDEE